MRCALAYYETLMSCRQTSASMLFSNSNWNSEELLLFRRSVLGGWRLESEDGGETLIETGCKGVGSGRVAGAGGVAGLAMLLDASPVTVSGSVSSSISQNEDASGLRRVFLGLALPSSAAKAWTRLDNLTDGLMAVDVVNEVRLERLRRWERGAEMEMVEVGPGVGGRVVVDAGNGLARGR